MVKVRACYSSLERGRSRIKTGGGFKGYMGVQSSQAHPSNTPYPDLRVSKPSYLFSVLI